MLDQLPAANPYSSKSQLTDATGLVPCSKEWVQHWYRKIDRVIAGEKNVDMRGVTLEVIDAIIHGGAKGTRHDGSRSANGFAGLRRVIVL